MAGHGETGDRDFFGGPWVRAYLEPAWRSQVAHAVGHVGLIGALRRISGRHTVASDTTSAD